MRMKSKEVQFVVPRLLISILSLSILTGSLFMRTAGAQTNLLVESLQEYLDFTGYADGAITAKQLSEVGLDQFYIVDARRAEDFEQDHLPAAVSIEWREILARRNELPTDKPVLLYCDTGLLSARAQLLLALSGRDNVKVLLGGYNAWKANSGKNE